jgi:hypothetical protein
MVFLETVLVSAASVICVGEYSLLHAELCALKWAHNDLRVLLGSMLSQGTVFQKTPALFVRGLQNGNSILGFDPQWDAQN